MNTSIKEQNGEVLVLFSGRLDTAAAAQTEADLKPLYNSENKTIVLDLSQLEYISSSGLRIFLSLLKATKAKGGQVVITNMNDDIRNVFTMTGFNSLFQFR